MTEDQAVGKLTCFVIGPIGDREADTGSAARKAYEDGIQIFEDVIVPACAAYGFAVIRSDRIARPGEITDQVCVSLRDAYLVIADLSGANPNVMYELGLRHTTGKLTIQIGERGNLPFDVNMIRTILFKRTDSGLVDARRKLAGAIAASLEGGGDPVTATRIWFQQGTAPSSQGQRDIDTTEQEDELGFLEKLAESTEGIASAIMSLQAIGEINTEITAHVTAAGQRMSVANKSGDPSARVFVANELAGQVAEPASRLEVLAGEFAQSISRVDFGVRYTLDEARSKPDDEQAQAFKRQLTETIATYRAMFQSTRAYREQVAKGAEATRSLRKVFSRIVRSLDVVLSTEKVFEGWTDLLGQDVGA
jgi:hypothetical protein